MYAISPKGSPIVATAVMIPGNAPIGPDSFDGGLEELLAALERAERGRRSGQSYRSRCARGVPPCNGH